MRWFILDYNPLTRAFRPLTEAELEPRPYNARPADGDPFRPWFEEEKDHVHLNEFGIVEGVHVRAESAGDAVMRAENVLVSYYMTCT